MNRRAEKIEKEKGRIRRFLLSPILPFSRSPVLLLVFFNSVEFIRLRVKVQRTH
jgi:hypothetical protein